MTYSSPHVVLAISQENSNELDAFLAHQEAPGVRGSLRAFGGLRSNEAKLSLPLIPETPHQEAGHDWEIIQVLVPLGVIAFLQGQQEEAMQLMNEILGRYHGVGDDWGRGVALLFSLTVIATQGDISRAAAIGQELLSLTIQSQSGQLMHISAVGVAWLGRSHGHPERLARLAGAAESMYQALGLVSSLTQRLYVAPTREALRGRMGREAGYVNASRGGYECPDEGYSADLTVFPALFSRYATARRVIPSRMA